MRNSGVELVLGDVEQQNLDDVVSKLINGLLDVIRKKGGERQQMRIEERILKLPNSDGFQFSQPAGLNNPLIVQIHKCGTGVAAAGFPVRGPPADEIVTLQSLAERGTYWCCQDYQV